MGVRRLAVANGPNSFQMLLVKKETASQANMCRKRILSTFSQPRDIRNSPTNNVPQFITYNSHRCSYVLSALWCWTGSRKGIRPVNKPSAGMLAWLSDCSEMQTWIRSSRYHWHSLSLASVNRDWFYCFATSTSRQTWGTKWTTHTGCLQILQNEIPWVYQVFQTL